MPPVLLSKPQQWLLLLLILLPPILLILMPWQWRWCLFAYLPYILLLGHFSLLVMSIRHPKYWELFKAYFIIPAIVHFSYGVQSIFAFFVVSPLAGGPLILLGFLMAPYVSYHGLESRIEKQEDALYLKALQHGQLDYHQLLTVNRSLTYTERGFLLRKLHKESDAFTTDELNHWVQRYATDWTPPEQSALQHLLKHPAIQPNVLLQFAQKHPNNYNLFTLAKNPNSPQEVIEICAQSDNFNVRDGALQSQRLSRSQSESILWEMIQDDPSEAKRYVLEASQATAPMLDQYIDLKRSQTSLIVRHASVTEAQLTQIAKHEIDWIRKLVAAHPHTSTETLNELSQESNLEVVEAAKFNLATRQAR